MSSAPSRFEVEHLHRLMMQASADASQFDKRLLEEQKSDGLSGELRHWHDAADAIFGAVERVKTDLLRDGTPKDQIERIGDRLKELKERAKRFDVESDLDNCVQHWKSLGLEFAQVSGKNRDALVKLLESRRQNVDRVTGVLSQARKTELTPFADRIRTSSETFSVASMKDNKVVNSQAANFASAALSSSLARCASPRVQAKIEAIEFVEVCSPFWCWR